MTLFIIFSSFFVLELKIDSSLDRYLKHNDPQLTAYMAFKNKFTDNEKILFGISSENVFSHEFLLNLKRFHNKLETTVPYLSRVDSLLTADIFKNDTKRLSISTLLKNWPASEMEWQEAVTSIRATPIYENVLFSKAENFTIVFATIDPCLSSKYRETDDLEDFADDYSALKKEIVPSVHCSLTEKEEQELMEAIQTVAQAHSSDDFLIYATGLPVYKHFIKQTMKKDAVMLVSLSSLLILFFLYIFFRRATGVVLPFIVVFCSMTSTLGLMALFGSPLKMPTSILPSLLLVVGIGDSIHILFRYFQNIDRGIGREEAICNAESKSGKALLLTSLTTVAGIASFSSADVAPVADIGVFGSIGVVIAFVYTIVLLPAILAVVPESASQKKKTGILQWLDKVFIKTAVFATKNAGRIAIVCLILALTSTMGVMKLKVSHNPLVWLPENEPVRLAAQTVDQQISGMINIEVLIQMKKGTTIRSADSLNSIETLHKLLDGKSINSIRINKTRSITDVVKLAHWALGVDNTATYELPDDPSLIFQELLLVEMGTRNLLNELTDIDFQTARFTIFVPWEDTVTYGPFLDKIDKISMKLFDKAERVTITGQIPLLVRTLNATIDSMIRSYLVCGITITLIMILLMKNFKLGLFSMIPNILPVWISLGIMGWLNFPLDLYTLLVGSIALGLIVDDTVHFMHYFNRYNSDSRSVQDSCVMTLRAAGPPMLITTVLIFFGAGIFTLATMNSLRLFGSAIAAVALLALLCDLIIVPALMMIIFDHKNRQKRIDKHV